MVYFDEDEKKTRRTIGRTDRTEWVMIKTLFKNSCVLCDKTERTVKKLEKAHLKAHSRGGEIIVPMCPTCHSIFDSGLLTKTQLKKLGITQTAYKRLLPKKNKKTSDSSW